ncbi:MAG: multimeric flavodoxin WrbA [bacterium]|jgi:multimeric flavodoxin WrbA
MSTKTLLIVINRPSLNTEKLANAVINGANHEDINGIKVVFREPLDATSEDVLNCDGILLGTTENFGYMSGVLKDFFERIYYPCIEHTEGLPYGLYVRAGLDGVGAQSAVERIVTGLRWSAIQPCVTLQGDYDIAFEQQCHELGMLMAAGLETGVF